MNNYYKYKKYKKLYRLYKKGGGEAQGEAQVPDIKVNYTILGGDTEYVIVPQDITIKELKTSIQENSGQLPLRLELFHQEDGQLHDTRRVSSLNLDTNGDVNVEIMIIEEIDIKGMLINLIESQETDEIKQIWREALNWNMDLDLDRWEGVVLTRDGGIELHLTHHNPPLEGIIPESIGDLTNLQVLHIFNNQLTGEIPESIGNLTNLEVLQLNDNNLLTGEIPDSIGNLTNLNYLNLSNTDLTGEIPDSIGNLTNLKNLSISNTQLTGEIPESIGLTEVVPGFFLSP
jgi:hypothetical protein